MTKKAKTETQGIPRFVLTITDTQTTGNGGVQMNLGIGADRLGDFVKFIPEAKRKQKNPGRNEFEAMLWFFAEQVAEVAGTKNDLEFNSEGKEGEE